MDKIKKIDDLVMKALDIKVIRRLICKTDKGELELVIRKGETRHFLTMDAVPLPKEKNDELMDILFKKEIAQVNKFPEVDNSTITTTSPVVIKKKVGRPKGMKSGINDMQ